jgi:hypothetical protein
MPEVTRFLGALFAGVFALGLLVGYGVATQRTGADARRLRGEVAELQQRSVFDEVEKRTLRRAVQRQEQRAVAAADSTARAARPYAAARGRVTIDGPFLIDTAAAAPDTLATDPRAAALVAKADTLIAALQAEAAAAWALVDTTQQLLAVEQRQGAVKDTIIATQDTLIAQLTAARRPRVGVKTGMAIGATLTAVVVWLAGGLAR